MKKQSIMPEIIEVKVCPVLIDSRMSASCVFQNIALL